MLDLISIGEQIAKHRKTLKLNIGLRTKMATISKVG
jgi:hypothetical protein